MKIVLSGIETNNKGAELMLYAILQEIERKHKNADVYIPIRSISQGLGYIKTGLSLKNKPWVGLKKNAQKFHIIGILKRLHIPFYYLTDFSVVKDVDYFLDASGFAFSDQWHHSSFVIKGWEYQLSGYKAQKTKIVFLPQAFGPVELDGTREELSYISKYADVIMPRDKVSLGFLKSANVDMAKVKLFTDFTSLVEGVFPNGLNHLRNGICVIPNMRMIDKGIVSFEDYMKLLVGIIEVSQSKGYKAYLLNHEGRGDEVLALKCQKHLNGQIEVVTGLNALEVKGLIASSYLCISSRFHGVASALNSCVPCLATSWSHKYAALFNDYCISDCILNPIDVNNSIDKLNIFLTNSYNHKIRQQLAIELPKIQNITREMWNMIWE